MSISIEAFRSDPERVREWRRILALPIVVEALEILRDVGPENTPLPSGLSPVDANILLGDEHGYARYPKLFKQFGETWPMKSKRLEESYGVTAKKA